MPLCSTLHIIGEDGTEGFFATHAHDTPLLLPDACGVKLVKSKEVISRKKEKYRTEDIVGILGLLQEAVQMTNTHTHRKVKMMLCDDQGDVMTAILTIF